MDGGKGNSLPTQHWLMDLSWSMTLGLKPPWICSWSCIIGAGRICLPKNDLSHLFCRGLIVFVGVGLVASGLVLLMLCCLAKSLDCNSRDVELGSKNVFGKEGTHEYHIYDSEHWISTDPSHPNWAHAGLSKDTETDEKFPIHLYRRRLTSATWTSKDFHVPFHQTSEVSTTWTGAHCWSAGPTNQVWFIIPTSLHWNNPFKGFCLCRHLHPKATRS